VERNIIGWLVSSTLVAPDRARVSVSSISIFTGMLPASPVRKGGVEGSYLKMASFLSGKPRPGGRGGFT